MPLYQKLGNDGFFVARRVRGFWLALSAALRTLRAGRDRPLAPGSHAVERRSERALDRIAGWRAFTLFRSFTFSAFAAGARTENASR